MNMISREEHYLMYERPRAMRIKEARKKLGQTQHNFSLSLGLGKTTVARIERGEMLAFSQVMELISYHYGVALSWLYHGTEPFYGEGVTDLRSIEPFSLFRIWNGHKAVIDKDWNRYNHHAARVLNYHCTKNKPKRPVKNLTMEQSIRQQEKVCENQTRRKLAGYNFSLRKSRGRVGKGNEGSYQIVDRNSGEIVLGLNFELTLPRIDYLLFIAHFHGLQGEQRRRSYGYTKNQ